MSRSRRAPVFTEGYGNPKKKLRKRVANKDVRNTEEVANGGSYRKVSNPWNICDFKFYSPKHPKAYRK